MRINKITRIRQRLHKRCENMSIIFCLIFQQQNKNNVKWTVEYYLDASIHSNNHSTIQFLILITCLIHDNINELHFIRNFFVPCKSECSISVKAFISQIRKEFRCRRYTARLKKYSPARYFSRREIQCAIPQITNYYFFSYFGVSERRECTSKGPLLTMTTGGSFGR